MSYSDYRPVEVAPAEVAPDQPRPDLDMGWVRVDRLVIDTRYQRPLGPNNWSVIRKIARAFDWAHFTPVLAAPLDDGYFALIDGQHRAHAARLAGFRDVPAMIMPLDHAAQARAFLGINGTRTNITTFHIFHAARAAGESWALQAEAAVSDAGCQLMSSNRSTAQKKPREIYVHALVRRMVEQGNAPVLTRALRLLAASKHESDLWVWSFSFLQPWLDFVEANSAQPDGVLGLFLETLDMRQMERVVSLLRDKPELRGLSQFQLYRRALIVLLEKAVQGAAGKVA